MSYKDYLADQCYAGKAEKETKNREKEERSLLRNKLLSEFRKGKYS